MFVRVDRFPGPDETVLGWDFEEAEDGGKGSHQAIACGRLGAAAAFVGCVGTDRLGDRAMDWLREAGVDTNYVARSTRASTGVGLVMLNAQGTPAIVSVLGANADLGPREIDRAEPLLARAAVALVSLEIPIDTALYTVDRCARLGTRVILNPAPAVTLADDCLNGVEILTPNQVEARQLLGGADGRSPEELGRALQRRFGIPVVVITMGAQGAVVLEAGQSYVIPALSVQAIDTVGAGDAFNAGLALALAKGAGVREAVGVGNFVAGCAVTRRGSLSSFPTLSVLRDFAERCGAAMPHVLLTSLVT
jgi:ribokinase